jgi:uncharacterized protein (DUF1501 family)
VLTLLGPRHRYCDGISRRSFLKVGSLGLGGLALPGLFRAEAQAGTRRSQKSVIMVYLSGGLAHQDTFDLKPAAPSEIRGEFKPIDTVIPGIQVGEHLPRLARCMDKMVVLRSIVGLKDEHSSWQNMTGYGMNEAKREGKPHAGAVIARTLGQADPVIPAFVDLFPTMQHKPYNSPPAGALGRPSNPVRVDGQDLEVMKSVVTAEQLGERRDLLKRLDGMRQGFDAAGMDVFYKRAFDVLTSSKMVEALDVTREPEKTRERYGKGSPKHQGDGAPQWNDQLLMARRLVEAGARCVTVAYGFWDTHGRNFQSLRKQLPLFDQGISALVEDVYDRGLDRDVTVLVWGEFGRTPKINKDAGRDHWAPVNGALFAGGGMKTGQVIGSTDKDAAYAKDTPIHYHDVIATVYRNLGIDPHAMVQDVAGRPAPILPGAAQAIARVY